jgi:23S rRNA pseudouridine1911/1915/1917 synthase
MHERFDVPSALDGERLDRTLALLTGLSRRQVNEVIDDRKVSIGRNTVTSHSRRVKEGEVVNVEGPLPAGEIEAPAPEKSVHVPVVWSDDDVIVVDKPAGLVVHPGAGSPRGTLVNGLLATYPDLAVAGGEPDRPGIVHRLDKGTSGLLVVARTPAAFTSLSAQMAARTVGREYLALVVGSVEADEGLIDAPLGRSEVDATKIRVQAGGRQARTEYRVIDRHSHPAPSTLVTCRLQTGRTHQIRVHFASIGHAVVGDERYGSRKLGNWEPLRRGRPFLHAANLEFDHPKTRRRLSFRSPLPADLSEVLEVISHGGPS